MGKSFNLKGKIVWKYEVILKTGMHIGGASSLYEIGAPDSPVVKDPVTNSPYLPGSSLKGKLRSLLERRYLDLSIVKRYHNANNKDNLKEELQAYGFRESKTGVIQFEDCAKYKEKTGEDVGFICKLFGVPGNKPTAEPTRLIVTDAVCKEWDGQYEIKGENALDRVTSAANPRFIERVPPGTKFTGYFIMNVYGESEIDELVTKLKEALELLARDYLGGHGSRGYGRVAIKVFDPEFYPPDLQSADGIGDVAAKLAGIYSLDGEDQEGCKTKETRAE